MAGTFGNWPPAAGNYWQWLCRAATRQDRRTLLGLGNGLAWGAPPGRIQSEIRKNYRIIYPPGPQVRRPGLREGPLKTRATIVVAVVSAALALSGCDQVKKLAGGGKPS